MNEQSKLIKKQEEYAQVKAKPEEQSKLIMNEIPSQIPELVVGEEDDLLKDAISLFTKEGLIQSWNEFMCMVKQGRVKIEGERIGEDDMDRVLYCGDTILFGKKKLIKIVK